MGLRLGLLGRDPARPWIEAERQLILALHANGANWAAIAEAVPERSAIAIFRKLSHLLGPAPFKSRPEPEPLAAPPLRRVSPLPTAPSPVRVGVVALVCWLRSRDFMVVRQKGGWGVDHHRLGSAETLLEFTNIRRSRLRLPPFALMEIGEDKLATISEIVPPRKINRFGSMGFPPK